MTDKPKYILENGAMYCPESNHEAQYCLRPLAHKGGCVYPAKGDYRREDSKNIHPVYKEDKPVFPVHLGEQSIFDYLYGRNIAHAYKYIPLRNPLDADLSSIFRSAFDGRGS